MVVPNPRGGQIHQHRLFYENVLGRPLKKSEFLHHRNGIRSDNRLENLELWTTQHPIGTRVEDKIKWCKEFLKEYDKEIN